MKKKWNKALPTEGGFYWFYGRIYRGACVNLNVVQVKLTSQGNPLYSKEDGLIVHKEDVKGVWMRIPFPILPAVTEKNKTTFEEMWNEKD